MLLILDGKPVPMQPEDATDDDYTDGAVFIYTQNGLAGQHKFR